MTDQLLLERVSVRYGEFTAVDNVSLQLEQGQIGCVLGPSGCGKTTLLRYLALLYARDLAEGTALVQERLGLEESGRLPVLLPLAAYAAAAELWAACERTSRDSLGEEDPMTLSSLWSLGTVLAMAGEYEQALPCLQEALSGCRSVFGDIAANSTAVFCRSIDSATERRILSLSCV